MTRPSIAFVLIALTLTAACNSPDPADYGGGARGEAVAKCIVRTERADSAVTRQQSGELCSCVTDKLLSGAQAALSGGGMSKSAMESAFIGCARKAGVEITD
ncbi:MAG: hypothetical protein AAF941_00935 [Pseudomonadota bacterium]